LQNYVFPPGLLLGVLTFHISKHGMNLILIANCIASHFNSSAQNKMAELTCERKSYETTKSFLKKVEESTKEQFNS
tara:strand:+ start:333 stop:560 length:228 start_codon:yes stop_codon:yes gene_type:complete